MTAPETDLSETPIVESDAQVKLRELTNQSWNLELFISGAALFATLTLADGLDDALMYYRYNLMPDESGIHDIIPTQIVSLCKAACYVLFGAFLANFVMRAFWVSLVGLLAAYPGGIRYDQIAMLSQYAREQYARRLGSLADYVIRLDRRCNVIFALASVVALMFLVIAIGSVVLITVVTMLQWTLSSSTYAAFLHIFRYVLIALYTVFMLFLICANIPAWRDNPRVASLYFHLSNGIYWLTPGVGKATQYITYTFLSNISKKTLYRRLGAVFALFMVVEIVTMLIDVNRVRGSQLFDSRSFMSLNAGGSVVESTAYDNLRPEAVLANQATIQADVIREPYVRLFVAYPKLLDEELTKRFKEPLWPDSLKRKERREQRATWRIGALNRYFQVLINDSLYADPGFLFTERPDNDQRGITTVLLPTNMKLGRNTLEVTIPDSGSTVQSYCKIPFWYVPEQ
ncbi:hypothetical protein [Spirosoma arcticum]